MGKGEFGLGAGARLRTQLYYTYAHSGFRYRSSFYQRGLWAADLPDMYWVSHILDGKARCDLELGSSVLLIGGVQLRHSSFGTENIIVSDDDDSRGAAFATLRWNPWAFLQISGGLRLELAADTEAVLSSQAAAVLRPWPDHAFRCRKDVHPAGQRRSAQRAGPRRRGRLAGVLLRWRPAGVPGRVLQYPPGHDRFHPGVADAHGHPRYRKLRAQVRVQEGFDLRTGKRGGDFLVPGPILVSLGQPGVEAGDRWPIPWMSCWATACCCSAGWVTG